jgi:GWxTD domain-containing protein
MEVRFRKALLMVVLGLLAAPVARAQATEREGDGLLLGTVRMYHRDGTTGVKVMLEVPHRLLSRSSDGMLRFWVGIKVQDSTGLTILNRGWPEVVKAIPGAPTASSMELFEFAVTEGRFNLLIAVRDSVSGKVFETSHEVTGYRGAPLISDLVLTPSLRVADAADTVPRQGEWRHGTLAVIASPYARVAAPSPQLYYLLEAYASQADSASLSFEVLNDSGVPLTRSKPKALQVDSGGSILSGGLNLNGVPQGQYSLRVHVKIGGRDTTAEAPFAIRQPEAVQQIPGGAQSDEEFFANRTEQQLDSLAAPLIYLAKSGEMSIYDKSLSASAKTRFLVGFWQQRNPTPGWPGNQAREDFYTRIGLVNELYRDPGRGATPGWRTDRGRIYLKFGKPDDTWLRQQEGITPPLEVWRYTTGRFKYFIFADRGGGIGIFTLVHSDENGEPGRPDWQEMIGYYGLQAVERYLGVDLGIRGGAPR